MNSSAATASRRQSVGSLNGEAVPTVEMHMVTIHPYFLHTTTGSDNTTHPNIYMILQYLHYTANGSHTTTLT